MLIQGGVVKNLEATEKCKEVPEPTSVGSSADSECCHVSVPWLIQS